MTPEPMPLVLLSGGYCPLCRQRLEQDLWCYECLVGWYRESGGHLLMYRVPDVDHSSELVQVLFNTAFLHGASPEDVESLIRRRHAELPPV